jgi:hypothetical protein
LVAGLAHIHSSLGEALHDNYKEHQGYSSSIKEGITRHVLASKKLLKELTQKLKTIFQKKHFEDLRYWNTFLDEMLESQTNTKKKIEQEKNYPKSYKYVSENSRLIKSGVMVLDEDGSEKFIVEASDKTVRLEGDKNWTLISKVKFKK